MQYVIVGVIVIGMLSSLTGAFLGARKAFEARSRQNIGIYKVSEDFQNADLGQIQKDARTAPLQVVGGIAEAAISSQAAAAPGVSPNPVGLGVGEGISAGQFVAQFAEDVSGPDATSSSTGSDGNGGEAPSGSTAAPAEGAAGALREGGVDVSTAPDEYHVAWYAEIDGERYLLVTPMDAFNQPEKLTDLKEDWIPFDASDHVVPVALTNAWADPGEIVWRIGDSATNWRREGDMKCTIAGVRYNCVGSEYLFGEYIRAVK